MERIRLTTNSILYFMKNEMHKKGINTIGEGDQTNLYRDKVPYYVRVMEGFPKTAKDFAVLPLVALDLVRSEIEGLQIGGGYRVYLDYVVEIFARRDGERDDLSEILYEIFDKDASLLNYEEGNFPTYVYSDAEGRLIEDYGGNVPPKIGDIIFSDRLLEIGRFQGLSEIENHRTSLSFRTQVLR